MTEFLDFLLSSPSLLPLDVTSETTLQEIITATIHSNDNSVTEPNCSNNSNDDDGAFVAALLASTATTEHGPTKLTTQTSYSITKPALETRHLGSKTSKQPINIADTNTGLDHAKLTTQRSYSTTHPALKTRLIGSQTTRKPTNIAYIKPQMNINPELKQQTPPQRLLNKDNVLCRNQQNQCSFAKPESYHQEQVQQLPSYYNYQSAVIGTHGYQSYQQKAFRPHMGGAINDPFDKQLYHTIDRLQMIADNLEQTVQHQVAFIREPRPVPTHPTTLKTRKLSTRSINLMEKWYERNINHPYPDKETVKSLANQCDISKDQVRKWFQNKRNRSQNTRRHSMNRAKIIQSY